MERFKNIFFFVITVLSAFVLIDLPSFALNARITDLPGDRTQSKVAIKKTENSSFVKAKINDLIRENGVIVTGKGDESIVELLIDSGSSKAIVRLGSQSYLKLTSSSEKVKLLLDEGKVLVQNTGLLNLNVYVGNYVASSDGTTFTVDVIETGDANEQIDVDVEVLEGKVKFNKEGEDVQKTYYILPGERAKFNLKFKKVSEKSMIKNVNIEKLEKAAIFEANRLNKLNRQLNEFSSGGAELNKSEVKKVKIEMKGPLFSKFKADLHQANLEKVKQNQQLQNQGQLENINNERRQKFLPQGHHQLNSSLMNNVTPSSSMGDSTLDLHHSSEPPSRLNNQSNSNIINQELQKYDLQRNNRNSQRNDQNNVTIKTQSKNVHKVKTQSKGNTNQNIPSKTVILSSPSSSSAKSTNTATTSDSTYYNKPKRHTKEKQTNVNNKQSGATRPDINRNPSLNEGVNSKQPNSLPSGGQTVDRSPSPSPRPGLLPHR